LICHAPVAVTSTGQRVDAQGRSYLVSDNPFLAATISTVPKIGERFALRFLYPRVPGRRTRLPYFVDVAIKEAGFTVASSPNISAPKLAYEPSVRLLTGNGPQAIDQQTAKLRTILTDTPAHQQQAAEQVTVPSIPTGRLRHEQSLVHHRRIERLWPRVRPRRPRAWR
jgi:hypothetical protein